MRRAGLWGVTISFTSVAVIAAVALLAPLAIGMLGLRLPAIVVEILLGIVVGPQLLGWASNDEPVQVLARPINASTCTGSSLDAQPRSCGPTTSPCRCSR